MLREEHDGPFLGVAQEGFNHKRLPVRLPSPAVTKEETGRTAGSGITDLSHLRMVITAGNEGVIRS